MKINVFQGNGEIDLPTPEGIAARWFFIKAGCGNTTPAAVLPFGRISACPFTGGYPTGYGNHKPNSHSRPPKLEDDRIYGFSHIHQSGTGAMGYYYNYLIVSPCYAECSRSVLSNEKAVPGYYSCDIPDIHCELTTSRYVAYHRYTFAKNGGRICFDFTNNGIRIPDNERRTVSDIHCEKVNDNTLNVAFTAEGVRLYFAICGDGIFTSFDQNSAEFIPKNRTCVMRVSLSLRSFENANEFLTDRDDFDTTKNKAAAIWEKALSRISIESDEKTEEIFYSNLYHSLVKPADFSGESFIYDIDAPFCADFNTFWDMYKSALPLIFLTDKGMSVKITETIMTVCETLGRIPNSWGLNRNYTDCDGQARMLGCYTLMTAYHFGIPMDSDRMLECIKTDLLADNKTDFTIDRHCKNYSWTLDMSECCALAERLANKLGKTDLATVFSSYARVWEDVYDKQTGLMKDESDYYEGSCWNYSFRPHLDMDRRIEIAGGNERFVSLLDKFFGYGAEPVIQPTNPFDKTPVCEGEKLGRFEGFNNESDTEAPFSYVYANRPDRMREIIRAGMKYMFTTGKGGLPGNNDSGALSSWYVWNALGLHPLAGFDYVFVTSPIVKSALVSLSSGNTLKINVSGEGVQVLSAKFNDREVTDCRIPLSELMQGGTLEFTLRL